MAAFCRLSIWGGSSATMDDRLHTFMRSNNIKYSNGFGYIGYYGYTYIRHYLLIILYHLVSAWPHVCALSLFAMNLFENRNECANINKIIAHSFPFELRYQVWTRAPRTSSPLLFFKRNVSLQASPMLPCRCGSSALSSFGCQVLFGLCFRHHRCV